MGASLATSIVCIGQLTVSLVLLRQLAVNLSPGRDYLKIINTLPNQEILSRPLISSLRFLGL
uniref:Uncharacterized protein n=1 Tax=Utricularia reniformis TaxID=192314 RepID=A0A1Y0AZV2_9LAMI|nr:hypothetical protein AEK19_MT0388 [Utricularia reniformis]ART30658.1 hypothetical protein AEK19_MT0388 [Utricularia reniformis]